jgi:hypothetical protein
VSLLAVAKGEYTLLFDPERHEYRLRGPHGERVLPSVNQVLSLLAKPKLQEWAVGLTVRKVLEGYAPGMGTEELAALLEEARKAPNEEAKRAQRTGANAHSWIESFLSSPHDPPPLPEEEEARRAVESFLSWWRERPRIPALREAIVAHPELGFAGRFDLLLGDGTLLDFKTSKAIYPEYELQVGAYALALEAWEGIRARRGMILRLGKDGSFEAKEVDLRRAGEAFKGLLAVWHYLNSGE